MRLLRSVRGHGGTLRVMPSVPPPRPGGDDLGSRSGVGHRGWLSGYGSRRPVQETRHKEEEWSRESLKTGFCHVVPRAEKVFRSKLKWIGNGSTRMEQMSMTSETPCRRSGDT